VSSEVDNFFPETFKYLNIRVLDIDQTDLIKEFDRTNKFIQEAKEQATSCLVHCKMGVSRSASVCLAYLMKEYDWSYDQAFSYTKQRRQCINPNDGFKSQLATYESILIAHKSKRNLFEPSSPSYSQQINIQVDGNVSPTLLPTAYIASTSVKDTINKLKSISSSEQLIQMRSANVTPPLSPTNVKQSVNQLATVKRSTSHLTQPKPTVATNNQNSETTTAADTSNDTNNENIQTLKSSHHHQRSKSSSNYNDNNNSSSGDVYCINKTARQSQSWASNQFGVVDMKSIQSHGKLKQISSNNLFMSENSLNYEPAKQVNQSTSSSSSSSSIRSAIRNSLIFTTNATVNTNINSDENSAFFRVATLNDK